MNNIIKQQILDLQRPIPFIPVSSTVPSHTGLAELCYNRGHAHAQSSIDPSPVVDGLDALPCTLSHTNNAAYTQGFIDGLGL